MEIGKAQIGDTVKFNKLAIKSNSSFANSPNYTIAKISNNKQIVYFQESDWKNGVSIRYLTIVKRAKDNWKIKAYKNLRIDFCL